MSERADPTLVQGLVEIAPEAAPTLPSVCDRMPPWAIRSYLGVPIAVVCASRSGDVLDVAGLPMKLVERLVAVANTWIEEQQAANEQTDDQSGGA